MKVISIQRPWPEAIMRGEKTIECRNWQTNYRGTLAIHVSLKPWGINFFDESYFEVKGAIIGTVELFSIIEYFSASNFHNTHRYHLVPMGNWTRFGWRFKNPVRLKKPILYKGKLGLWNVPDELLVQSGLMPFK